MRILFTAAVLASLSIACGGSDPPVASPNAPGASSATPGPSGDPASAASAGPTTTTTTTLGNGGDLSGSKLTTASSSTVQTTGTTGPTPEPHQQEVGRSVKDIRTIVMTHRDEARKCYDDGLKAHPGVEGDIDIKFTIDPKGNVSDAVVNDDKSSIHEPSIGACISDVIKKIHFSESAKGFETRAHYPFNFHPKQGGSPSNNNNAQH